MLGGVDSRGLPVLLIAKDRIIVEEGVLVSKSFPNQ